MSPQENKKEPKSGYDILTDYISADYSDIPRDQIYKDITNNPDRHDAAMRKYHEDNYYDRDFYTFQQQWYKKYGRPAGAKDPDVFGYLDANNEEIKLKPSPGDEVAIAPGVEEKDTGIESGLLPFDLSVNLSETEQEFARVAEKYRPTDEQLKKIRENEYKAAYESIVEKRKGDYETPADLLNLGDPATHEAWRRTLRRSPVEMYLGLKKGDATFSTFEKGMTLLSDEFQTIPRAVQHLRNELKLKYGDEVLDLIQQDSEETLELRKAVEADPVWEEINALGDLYNKTAERAKGYIQDPEFAGVRKLMDRQKAAQSAADASAGGTPYSGRYYLTGMLARSFGKLAGGVAAVMDAGENLVSKDKNYGAWDLTEDFLIDVSRDLQNYMFPLPTAGQRGIVTKDAAWKLDGKDVLVEYDKSGKAAAIRYPNGNLHPKQIDDLSEMQKASISKLQSEKSFNWNTAFIKTGEVFADLGVQIALTRGLGKVGTAAGLGQKTAGTIGLTGAVAGQMMEPVYEQMKESLGDTRQAAAAALLAVTSVGLASNLFGFEKQLAGMGAAGKQSVADIMAQAVKSLNKAKPFTTAGRAGAHLVKTGVGEAFEESIVEPLVIGTAGSLFGAPPEEFNFEEFAETAGISFATGLFGGIGGVNAKPSYLQGHALYLASMNPDLFEKTTLAAIDNGIIKIPTGKDSKIFASQQRERAMDIRKQIEAVQDRIPEDIDMGDFVRLLDERIRAKRNLDQAKVLEWGRTKTEELEGQMERLNQAMEKSLRSGDVTIPTGPPKPSEEQSFLPDEKAVEPEVETPSLQGAEAGVDGRVGTIQQEGDSYSVKTEAGTQLALFPVEDNPLDHNVRIRKEPQVEEATQEPPPESDPTVEPTVEDIQTEEQPEGEAPMEPAAEQTAVEEPMAEVQDIEQEFPELFPGATIEDLPGEDIGEGEVDQAEGDRLDVAINMNMHDWANRDYKELEAMVAGVGNPELDQMVEKFRSLPEHPRNYSPGEPNADALAESFANHKRRFIEDLKAWAGMDAETAQEMQQGENYDREEVDSELESLAEEYNDEFWEKAAERIAKELESENPDPEAAMEEAAKTEKEPLEGLPEETEVEKELENWAEMDDASLLGARERLTAQVATAQNNLTRAQQEASDEAMDMVAYSYDDDFNHAAYVKEKTAPYRKQLHDLKDKRRQVDRLIDERKQDAKVREEVQKDDSGVVVNNDIGFFGLGLNYIGAIFETAFDFIMNSPKTSGMRAKFGIGSTRPLRALKSTLFTSGHMGNYRIWNIDQDRKNEINGYTARASLIDRRFKKHVKKLLPDITTEEIQALDRILKDPNLMGQDLWVLPGGRAVPIEIVDDLRDMRSLVTRLSTALIDANVVDGDLATVINDNLNTYVTRQYEAHFNDRWAKLVEADKSAGSVWGKARNWAGPFLQKWEDDLVQRRAKAKSHLDRHEAALQAGNNNSLPKVQYWQEKLDEIDERIREVRDNQSNIDGFIASMLYDQTNKLTGTAGAKTGQLGSKPMGILKERGKSARKEDRKRVENKIRSSERNFEKLKKKRAQLIREIDRRKQQGSPVKMKTRDKKVAAQRQKDKYKAKKRRLEARIAGMQDVPQNLKDRLDFYDSKINQYQQIADDLDQQMAFEQAQEPRSVAKLEDDLQKIEDKITQVKNDLVDLGIELDQINDQDIPQELRDLWGEVKDPSMNFVATVHKQAHLLANHKFLTNLRDQGFGKFLFITPPNEKYAHRLALPGSKTMAPLNGLYTSREVADVFNSYNETTKFSEGMAFLAYYSALTKKNLTVLYHLVGLRNLFGAAWSFQGMQGDYTRGVAAALNWMFLDGNIIGVGLRAAGVGKMADGVRGQQSGPSGPSLMDKMYEKFGADSGNAIFDYLKSIGLGIAQSFIPDKTVLKDVTQARQLTYGIDVWNNTPHEMEAEYEDAHRRGLWDEDFTFGAYRDAIEQYGKQERPTGIQQKSTDPVAKKVVKTTGNAIVTLNEKATDRYRSADNAGRYFRYLTEQRKYARALYGKGIDQLTADELTHVKNIAAEIAKSVYPTISRVPKAFKELSKAIWIGDFVTFPVAMVQVQYNTIRLAANEIRNPKTAGLGVMRLLGVATVDMMTKAAFDAVSTLFQGDFSDEDDREEIEDRFRAFLPDFSDNSSVTVMPAYNEDGSYNPEEFYYIDHSSQSPGTITTRPIGLAMDLAFGRESKYKSTSDKLWKSIAESVSPFHQVGIAYQGILEAGLNKRDLKQDRLIIPEEATLKEKVIARLGHALGVPEIEKRKVGPYNEFPVPDIKPGGVIPGTIGMTNRTVRSLIGEPTSYGTLHNPYHEALSWAVGTRITKINIPTSLYFKHAEKAKALESIWSNWSRLPNRDYLKRLPDEEFWKHPDVQREMKSTQAMYEKVLTEGMMLDRAAKDQGLNTKDRIDIMEKAYSNYDKKTIRAIVRGKYRQYDFKVKGRTKAPALEKYSREEIDEEED